MRVLKNKSETDKKFMNENSLTKENLFNNSDIIFSNSTPKAMKDKVEEDTSKEEMLNCKESKC